MIFHPDAIEWLALVVGTVGTVLWALGRNQLVVSVLWLAGSLLWIAFAFMHNHAGLTLRDALGAVLCLIGIRTYWLAKRAGVVSPPPLEQIETAMAERCAMCRVTKERHLAGSGSGAARCACGA